MNGEIILAANELLIKNAIVCCCLFSSVARLGAGAREREAGFQVAARFT